MLDFIIFIPALKVLITHSKREAYMDLVENGGGGGRQEIEEPQGM